jgi:hypothetical protein
MVKSSERRFWRLTPALARYPPSNLLESAEHDQESEAPPENRIGGPTSYAFPRFSDSAM